MLKHLSAPIPYFGGKHYSRHNLASIFPEYTEYREPFLGGGSVLLTSIYYYPNRKHAASEIKEGLHNLWVQLKSNPQKLREHVLSLYPYCNAGRGAPRALLQNLKDMMKTEQDAIRRAALYYVAQKIGFAGIEVERNKSAAFAHRQEAAFTHAVYKLDEYASRLQDVELLNADYSVLLERNGKDVFLFLDPPYVRNDGRYGSKEFDFEQLSDRLLLTKHKFLMTINDTPEIRRLFGAFIIKEVDVSYCANRSNQKVLAGGELLVSNYEFNIQDYYNRPIMQRNSTKPLTLFPEEDSENNPAAIARRRQAMYD